MRFRPASGTLNGLLGFLLHGFFGFPYDDVPEDAEKSLVRNGKSRASPMKVNAAQRSLPEFFVVGHFRLFEFQKYPGRFAYSVYPQFRFCPVGRFPPDMNRVVPASPSSKAKARESDIGKGAAWFGNYRHVGFKGNQAVHYQRVRTETEGTFFVANKAIDDPPPKRFFLLHECRESQHYRRTAGFHVTSPQPVHPVTLYFRGEGIALPPIAKPDSVQMAVEHDYRSRLPSIQAANDVDPPVIEDPLLVEAMELRWHTCGTEPAMGKFHDLLLAEIRARNPHELSEKRGYFTQLE